MLTDPAEPLAFAAEIPAAALTKGALLRWAATATLPGFSSSSSSSSSASAQSIRCPRRQDDWLGTAVLDPEEPSKLTQLEWFRSPNSSGGGGNGNGNGSGDWIWFGGALRPLASVTRKGTTSLGWPKPKLKLEFKKGYDDEEGGGGESEKLVLRPPFVLEGDEGGGAAPMSSVDLDSLWVRKRVFFLSFFASSKTTTHSLPLPSFTTLSFSPIFPVGARIQQLRQAGCRVRGAAQRRRGE
jgi:hypothetical protein